MGIRVLSHEMIGRIAAGEVVERPASIVKELMENSIDAGATSITVDIRDGGIGYIRVTDNGCGIAPGEARLAFENHATSKLFDGSDLSQIMTLGFRGEAIPSIAAVSRLEMTTRTRDALSGVRILCEGGAITQVTEMGCPNGTTMVMKDLFYNTPPRRAFLKRPRYEQTLALETVGRMILGHPSIAIKALSSGKVVMRSAGDGDLRNAVFTVYGREFASGMKEVDGVCGGLHLWGLVGVMDCAASTRAMQAFFVNGRHIRCPMLTQALENVCRGRVMADRYPSCVLYVEMPPESVDINVHPSKREVRFRDEATFHADAETILRQAFEGERVLSLADIGARENGYNRASSPVTVEHIAIPAEAPVPTDTALPQPGMANAVQAERSTPSDPETVSVPAAVVCEASPALSTRIRMTETPTLQHPPTEKATPECPPAVEAIARAKRASEPRAATVETPSKPLVPRAETTEASEKKAAKTDVRAAATKPAAPVETSEQTAMAMVAPDTVPYRIIGTLFHTYILLEVKEALVLIDQHAAHERIQFEAYARKLTEGHASQTLLTPLLFHTSAREHVKLMENQEKLREAGYEIEAFGERDVQIRAVPFILGQADIAPVLADILQNIDCLAEKEREKYIPQIMQLSCKHAVKANDVLTESEIRALLDAMQSTGASPTCPHGRPVMRYITRREIEAMVKRVV